MYTVIRGIILLCIYMILLYRPTISTIYIVNDVVVAVSSRGFFEIFFGQQPINNRHAALNRRARKSRSAGRYIVSVRVKGYNVRTTQ